MDNIEKVLDRGEKIEVLVDKTEALRFQADNFHKQGRALRNRMWWNNLKMKLILLVFVIGVRDYYFLRVLFRRGEELHGKEEEQQPGRRREDWREDSCWVWLRPELKASDGVDVEMENNRGGAFLLEN